MSDTLKGLGGVPLLRMFPNWAAAPKYSFLNSFRILEYQGTANDFVEITDRKPQNFSCEMLLSTKEEEFNFMAFWRARKGALERFWLPVYPEMFTLTTNALSTTTTLTCEYTATKFNKERVYIHKNSGDFITAKVNSYTSDEDINETVLTLTEQLGANVLVSEIESFGFLLLCKFAKDSVEFNYENSEVTKIGIEVRELIEYEEIV